VTDDLKHCLGGHWRPLASFRMLRGIGQRSRWCEDCMADAREKKRMRNLDQWQRNDLELERMRVLEDQEQAKVEDAWARLREAREEAQG
jgi:hypothetical protein